MKEWWDVPRDTTIPWDGTLRALPQSDEPLDPVERYGRWHAADAYAGVYVDGPVTRVGFTRDAERHLAELRRHLTERIESFAATHTLLELEALHDRILSEDEGVLRPQGIEWTIVGIDVIDNVVDLAIDALTEQRHRFLAERYGPAVRVSEGRAELV